MSQASATFIWVRRTTASIEGGGQHTRVYHVGVFQALTGGAGRIAEDRTCIIGETRNTRSEGAQPEFILLGSTCNLISEAFSLKHVRTIADSLHFFVRAGVNETLPLTYKP